MIFFRTPCAKNYFSHDLGCAKKNHAGAKNKFNAAGIPGSIQTTEVPAKAEARTDRDSRSHEFAANAKAAPAGQKVSSPGSVAERFRIHWNHF